MRIRPLNRIGSVGPWRLRDSRVALLVLAFGGASCGGSTGAPTTSTPTTTTTTTTSTPAPAVTLTPTGLSFPNAVSIQTLTIANTGTADLTISGISISGNFAQTNDCPGSLPPEGMCTITATFTPLAVTAPAASGGQIKIVHDAPGSPQFVQVSGPAVTAGTAAVSPRTVAFASQAVGTVSDPQTVTVTNVLNGAATVPLRILTIDAEGDFRVTQTTCGRTLSAATACAVQIVFGPTSVGNRIGVLNVASDASVGLSVSALTGSGR